MSKVDRNYFIHKEQKNWDVDYIEDLDYISCYYIHNDYIDNLAFKIIYCSVDYCDDDFVGDCDSTYLVVYWDKFDSKYYHFIFYFYHFLLVILYVKKIYRLRLRSQFISNLSLLILDS